MDNNISFETARKRTERYWYEDGIWEIGFGLINLLLAAHYFVVQWLIDRQLNFLLIFQPLTLLAIIWVMSRLVRFLKERITYPRTGYVAYRRKPLKARAKRILFLGLLSAAIATGLALASASSAARDSIPLITGVIMSAMIIYIAYRFSLLRLFALAALTLALSLVVTLLRLDESTGRVVFFGGYGVLFMLSGGLVLANYLRRTKPADETSDYEAPASLEED